MVHERKTIIVADTSGSMREHGKATLARNLLAHVRQVAISKTEPSSSDAPILVQWSSDATILRVPSHEDLPSLSIGGRAAMQPLLALLDEFTVDGIPLCLLMVSDGHLPTADVAAFRAWVRKHSIVVVRTIAVGPDAAIATLARMTGATEAAGRQGERTCYRPEDICAALDSWPRVFPELPVFTAEVTGVLGSFSQ